jgi:carbon catabolite-derepressing protein kinase
MLSGGFPHKAKGTQDLYARIVRNKFEIPETVPEGAAALISRILVSNPALRPDTSEILDDPWLDLSTFSIQRSISTSICTNSIASEQNSITKQKTELKQLGQVVINDIVKLGYSKLDV